MFDARETIDDETRAWSAWADWLGIPRLTLLAVCGAVIARANPDVREPFRIMRPAAAGMQAIFIRRGPSAWIQSPVDDPPEGALTVNSLAELPAALAGLR